MDKRSFIRLSMAGSAAGIIMPKSVLAAGMDSILQSRLAGGVFYTAEKFGRWNKALADHHLPHLDKQVSGGKAQLQAATSHPMNAWGHYIIKHQLLDAELKFMQEHPYHPEKDKSPMATFDLGSYRGVVYVLTMCNVHDLWMNMIEV
jgi:superoxide reductase